MIGCIVEERYLVEAELGNGAMGRVYAARHVKVGRRVAIKVMHEELARNPMVVERFAREALVAARLRHPNLVSVLDVGSTPDGRPLIVLELAPGIALSEIPGALEAPRVVRLIRQLLEGLEHAHAAGLIHRDLKPDNILVDEDDTPRIVDFGIAVDSTGSTRRLTEANIVIGTPFYMSPEQARAKKIDHRSDLFSLGVIMYELLAGMPPFPGSSVEAALANATREPPSIYERAGIAVDPLLETFARKLMARELSERFGSAREALQVLALISDDRLAAARALAARPAVDMVHAIGNAAAVVDDVGAVVEVDANTDGLSTVVDVVVQGIAAMDDVAVDDFAGATGARTLMRRRKRFGFAIATAALVMLAAVGFAARGEQAAAPRGELDASESISTSERLAMSETVVAEPTAIVMPKRETADPRIVELLAMTKASTKSTTMMKSTTSTRAVTMSVASAMSMASASPVASALAVDVKPAVVDLKPAVAQVQPPVGDSADSVVAKYVAVGKALKTAKSDELWARFRLIRINEAIATPDGRRNTLVVLAAIEKQLR